MVLALFWSKRSACAAFKIMGEIQAWKNQRVLNAILNYLSLIRFGSLKKQNCQLLHTSVTDAKEQGNYICDITITQRN